MNYKLVGIENYYGEFTNKDNGEVVKYDSYKLHLLTDVTKRGQDIKGGMLTDCIKVKKDMIEKFTLSYLQTLIDKPVTIEFDRYGNLVDIREKLK